MSSSDAAKHSTIIGERVAGKKLGALILEDRCSETFQENKKLVHRCATTETERTVLVSVASASLR